MHQKSKENVSFREKLTIGGYAVGSWVNSRSTVVAELMAACGFDYLVVDVEHSAVDLPLAQDMFQAIVAGNPNCYPMVRLPGNEYSTTKRFMDAGAKGVIAPLINSSDQAEEVVAAVKYPPQGKRGLGFGRSSMYGLEIDWEIQNANSHSFVCLQIEHIDGVNNIDEILGISGIDAVFIGPYDLSASMGHPGELDHPSVIEAQNQIMAACQKSETFVGIHVVKPDVQELWKKFEKGYQLLAYSLDITFLTWICQKGLTEFQNLIEQEKTHR